MGKLKQKEKKQQEIIAVAPGYEEEQKQVNGIIEPAPEQEKQNDPAAYYERILKNSLDQNLALKIKSQDIAEAGEWEVVSTTVRPAFREKLPAERDTYKARKAESKAVSDAKKTFRNADLCTVREKHHMENYFKDLKKNGDVPFKGDDAFDNPALAGYVDSILTMELSPAVFTDDYLSDHIAELYDYTRKLGKLSSFMEKYPNYYRNLSDEKKALLSMRASAAPDLDKILKKHMYLHGIEMKSVNGEFRMVLRKEDTDKRKRHAERDRLKREYDQELRKLVSGRLAEDEVNLAKSYTKDDIFNSAGALSEVEAGYRKFAEARDACGEEMDTAIAEMKKAWAVRDELLDKQKELLRKFDSEKNKVLKDELRVRISRNNRRIRLVSAHADNYKDFLNYVTGQVPEVSDGTAKFLEAENRKDLLDVIHFKRMGDCMEEALVGNDRMEARKKIEDLKGNIGESESGDFVVYDMNEQDKVQAKQLEEYLKSTTYVKMPMENFYSLYKEYKVARERSDRYKKLWAKGMVNVHAAQQKADDYAKMMGLKDTGEEDRFFIIFRQPFETKEKGEKGGIHNSHTDLSFYESFSLFSKYKMDGNTSDKVREEVKNAIQPFIDKLLSMTPEKIQSMACPEEPDFESKEYWENRAFIIASYDTGTILKQLGSWGISLTDEQYAHITAIGKVAEAVVGSYDEAEIKLQDPMSIVIKNKRFTGKKVVEAYENVFRPLYNGDGDMPDDNEVAEKLHKYEEEKPGNKATVLKDNRQHTMTISEAVGYYANRKYINEASKIGDDENADPKDLYTRMKERTLGEIKEKRNMAFEQEKTRAKEYFAGITDEQIRTRVMIKEHLKLKDLMTEDLEQRWSRFFGTTGDGASDFRSFRLFLRPVKYDANGVQTEESRKEQIQNNKDIEDYISGDVKRRNRVLKRIAKEMAALEITDEMFTQEYMQKNPDKLYPILQKIHGFQNIQKEYPDFFESDALTEDERDRIRKNLSDSMAFSNLTSTFGVYCNTFGASDSKTGEVVIPKDLDTVDKKKNWGDGQTLMFNSIVTSMFEDMSKDGVKGALAIREKRNARYAEHDDIIRRASVLYAKVKAELCEVQRTGKIKTHKISLLPEGSRKKKLQKEFEAESAERVKTENDLKAKLVLAEEIKKYAYGEQDALSPEAEKLFNEMGTETVIHVEVEPEEVIKEPVKKE